MLFSSAHRTFTTIGHILGCKTNLNKFLGIYIIQSMFLNNTMELNVKSVMKNTEKS